MTLFFFVGLRMDLLLLVLPCVYYGAPVAQWAKRWPTDLADRVRSSLAVKSFQP